MTSINTYQIRKIYAIAGALGMKGNDRYDPLHDLISDITGKESVRDLSYADACRVIGELEARQGTPPRKGGRPLRKSAPGRVSEGQQRKIWALMYKLEEASPSTAPLGNRLCAIIKKTLGVDAFPAAPFAWVDYKGGNKVIEALKGYVTTAQKHRG